MNVFVRGCFAAVSQGIVGVKAHFALQHDTRNPVAILMAVTDEETRFGICGTLNHGVPCLIVTKYLIRACQSLALIHTNIPAFSVCRICFQSVIEVGLQPANPLFFSDIAVLPLRAVCFRRREVLPVAICNRTRAGVQCNTSHNVAQFQSDEDRRAPKFQKGAGRTALRLERWRRGHFYIHPLAIGLLVRRRMLAVARRHWSGGSGARFCMGQRRQGWARIVLQIAVC